MELIEENMIKTCSLDFLNREIFETDIMTSDGRVLVSANDRVTPDMILRLYFKDIYVKDEVQVLDKQPQLETEIETEQGIIEKTASANADSKEEKELLEKGASIVASSETAEEESESKSKSKAGIIEGASDAVGTGTKLGGPVKNTNSSSFVEGVFADIDEDLKFDEDEAQKVSEYALKMGTALNFSKDKLEDLKESAYYHNIGRIKFKESDLTQKNFRTVQAQAGYEILLNEKQMKPEIAETAKFYITNYESSSFALDGQIPYYHIVAIASYYNRLMSKCSKQEALEKMLRHGGNKFNIFVLHKFIRIMKESNEQ